MNWGIGLRNIKTGIAICICLVIAVIFKLNSPFYAAIATIISMENTITNSFAAGRHRTMGTLVGALIGACFAFVDPGNVLLCALGVVIVIYICNLLHWNKSVSIGCIVFLAVMLNLTAGGTGASPWAYGFHRIVDTLVGIAVAVAVNYLVFPPRLEERLEQQRVAFAEHLSLEFKKLAERDEAADLPQLRKELINLEQSFDQWKNEIHPRKQTSGQTQEKADLLASYRQIYEHLVILERLREEERAGREQVDPQAADAVESLPPEAPVSSPQKLQEKVKIVYAYHRDWIHQELRKQGLPVPDLKAYEKADGG